MRKPIVSRTIKSTKCTALIYNKETKQPETKEFVIQGDYSDPKKALKKLQKEFNTPVIDVVHVIKADVTTKLYGMEPEKFLKLADELDPVTRKLLKGNGEEK